MFMTLSFFFLNPKTQSDDGPLGGKQCPHNKTEEAVFPKLSAISCPILTRHWICRDLALHF